MVNNLTFYDIEVFKHGWCVTFKKNGQYKSFISKSDNDNTGGELKEWLDAQNLVMGGFNSKHYDDHLLMAMTMDCNHHEIKELNDWIIGGNQGWEWGGFPQYMRRPYNTFDVRDDLPIDLSLKAIEGNLGLPVVESSVSFDIDRPLTDKEWEEVIEYNKFDIDATQAIYEKRKNYFESKITIGSMIDLEPHKSLKYTNAKLTALFLGAEKREYDDERQYVFPKELNLDRIPQEVIKFFEQMYDKTIKDDDLWSQTLTINVRGVDYVYGFGGVHGAIPNYQIKAETGKKILIDDVESLYPNLMIEYGYVSRNVRDPEDFKSVVARRIKAKHSGDKTTSDALKLVINTAYGAMLNKYNALYDPKMARSVCITGQLLLTDLVIGLQNECPSTIVINFNTDGVAFSIDESEIEKANSVIKEWETRTRLRLESTEVNAIWQKDVNNYIQENKDLSIKTKGGYLATIYGKSINNGSLTVVSNAIMNYFVNGIDPRQYINYQNNLLDYQMIAKAGRKFDKVVWESSKGEIEVQKVNRVYASKNKVDGTLFKLKVQEGRRDKIASVPPHCLIDNDNNASIDMIDKEFYIDMAYKRIRDFIGNKEEKMNIDDSGIPAVAQRKTYLKLNNESMVFEKGDLIPVAWEKAIAITKKQFDEMRKSRPDEVVEEKKKMSQVTQPLSLAQKIFKLRQVLNEQPWNKDGINQHQEYKYISGDQYRDNLNRALLEVGLDYQFNIEEVNVKPITEIGGKMHLTEVRGTSYLIDPDTDTRRAYSVAGHGSDNLDKGLYKAETGALKYFVSTNFLVGEKMQDVEESVIIRDKPSFTTPAKREEIKQELMKDEPLATAEEKALIKDYMSQISGNNEFVDLIDRIKSVPIKSLTQNLANAFILELEEAVDGL